MMARDVTYALVLLPPNLLFGPYGFVASPGKRGKVSVGDGFSTETHFERDLQFLRTLRLSTDSRGKAAVVFRRSEGTVAVVEVGFPASGFPGYGEGLDEWEAVARFLRSLNHGSRFGGPVSTQSRNTASRDGEIGSRTGRRTPRPKGLAGSSPAPGTVETCGKERHG